MCVCVCVCVCVWVCLYPPPKKTNKQNGIDKTKYNLY